MIEFELKLEVENFPDLSSLEQFDDKHIVDTYYDTKDYALLSTGNFLRNRNNRKVDFKLNIGDASHTFCNETRFNFEKFAPNKDLQAIFENLGLRLNPNFESFDSFLKANNLSLLAIIDKHRKSFKFDDLVVCLDEAKDIGKFIEIECMLPDNEKFDKDKLSSAMLEKLKNANFLPPCKPVKIGYVELYLKRHNPTAYNLGLYKD